MQDLPTGSHNQTDPSIRYLSKASATVAVFREFGAAADAVYACLVDHCGHEVACWPSQSTIAGETGLSRRSVRRARAALEAGGMIGVTRRVEPDGGFDTNVYHLLRLP